MPLILFVMSQYNHTSHSFLVSQCHRNDMDVVIKCNPILEIRVSGKAAVFVPINHIII